MTARCYKQRGVVIAAEDFALFMMTVGGIRKSVNASGAWGEGPP
jgi:hypothetical protein